MYVLKFPIHSEINVLSVNIKVFLQYFIRLSPASRVWHGLLLLPRFYWSSLQDALGFSNWLRSFCSCLFMLIFCLLFILLHLPSVWQIFFIFLKNYCDCIICPISLVTIHTINDEDDGDELFLQNGWPTNDVKPYF